MSYRIGDKIVLTTETVYRYELSSNTGILKPSSDGIHPFTVDIKSSQDDTAYPFPVMAHEIAGYAGSVNIVGPRSGGNI
jgi:hypothetical protein